MCQARRVTPNISISFSRLQTPDFEFGSVSYVNANQMIRRTF